MLNVFSSSTKNLPMYKKYISLLSTHYVSYQFLTRKTLCITILTPNLFSRPPKTKTNLTLTPKRITLKNKTNSRKKKRGNSSFTLKNKGDLIRISNGNFKSDRRAKRKNRGNNVNAEKKRDKFSTRRIKIKRLKK